MKVAQRQAPVLRNPNSGREQLCHQRKRGPKSTEPSSSMHWTRSCRDGMPARAWIGNLLASSPSSCCNKALILSATTAGLLPGGGGAKTGASVSLNHKPSRASCAKEGQQVFEVWATPSRTIRRACIEAVKACILNCRRQGIPEAKYIMFERKLVRTMTAWS